MLALLLGILSWSSSHFAGKRRLLDSGLPRNKNRQCCIGANSITQLREGVGARNFALLKIFINVKICGVNARSLSANGQFVAGVVLRLAITINLGKYGSPFTSIDQNIRFELSHPRNTPVPERLQVSSFATPQYNCTGGNADETFTTYTELRACRPFGRTDNARC